MSEKIQYIRSNTIQGDLYKPHPIVFYNNYSAILSEKDEAMQPLDYLDDISEEENKEKYSSNIILISSRSTQSMEEIKQYV